MSYLRSSDEEDYSSSSGEEDDEELAALAASRGEGDEDGEDAGPRKKYGVDRPAIYNVDAMHDKLEDIAWLDNTDFLEHQVVTSAEPVKVGNVDDDVERELAFYNQALEAAKAAVGELEARNVPWLRPRDYYAEMVKSDEHMARVKEQLMLEQKSIQEMEERRKARMQKKFAKQVQVEKQKDRAQQRKKDVELIQRWRKDREARGFEPGEEFDEDTLRALEKRITPARAGNRRAFQGPKSKKRVAKDTKFGRGGKQSGRKRNDATSAADMGSFRPANAGVKKGGAKGGGKPKGRPGKAKRANMRSKF